jgi:hypothetical protein
MIAEEDRVAARYTLTSVSPHLDNSRQLRSVISIYRIQNNKLAEEWLMDEEFR